MKLRLFSQVIVMMGVLGGVHSEGLASPVDQPLDCSCRRMNVSEWYHKDGHDGVVAILSGLAHIPGICLTDSQNKIWVHFFALVDLILSSSKVAQEVSGHPEGSLAKCMVYDMPKSFFTLLGTMYDVMRLTGKVPDYVAMDDAAPTVKLKFFKIAQLFQLALEIGLRMVSLFEQSHNTIIGEKFAEAADWVEIWRLLSRFAYLADVDETAQDRIIVFKKMIAHFFGNCSEAFSKKVALFPFEEHDLQEKRAQCSCH
ncbi:MAG: hypothetical protein US69_C0002G0091 [candidate division TM6 bacterium GW2011_GWF2_38_10]|nr:MAG: hypothetical protein US69_C0002G0091 [candidate division TM6 bacterium GW2011_GWF2_38_10]